LVNFYPGRCPGVALGWYVAALSGLRKHNRLFGNAPTLYRKKLRIYMFVIYVFTHLFDIDEITKSG